MRLAALLVLCLPAASFAADPPTTRSAKSGSWSDAATWADNKVPGAGARVLIREGHRVVYDIKSDAVIRGLNIGGALVFATDKDTELNVGLIKIQPEDEQTGEGFGAGHARRPEHE